MNQWVLIYFQFHYKDGQIYIMVVVYLISKHEQATGAVTLVWNYTRYEFFVNYHTVMIAMQCIK